MFPLEIIYSFRLDTVRPVEGPAGQWLEDIRVTTDMECTCVLQGKSLTRDTTDVIFTTHTSLKGTPTDSNSLDLIIPKLTK